MVNSTTASEQLSVSRFWDWSLALYPQIKPLCLAWQDDYGLNVNLMLLLLYLQQQQRPLTTRQLQQLIAALAPQQAFTQQLRQLRRQLPAHLAAADAARFKQQLLQAELCSEQLEQQCLITTLSTCECSDENADDHADKQPVAGASSASYSLLARYLDQLQVPITSALQQQLIDLDQTAAKVLLASY